jgi:hypothetical protein
MAKNVTSNPWVFDAAAQAEGKDETGTLFDHPIYVKHIIIDAGATGGAFEVTEGSGGRSLTGTVTLAANGWKQIVVAAYVDSVYMASLVAGGSIHVYHGK